MPALVSSMIGVGLGILAIAMTGEPAMATGDRALGEYLSSECSSCHQSSGRQAGGIPAIIGHPADQFMALMQAYKSKHRDNQVMQTIAARLSQDELEALAAYYQELKPAP